jgi:hypothetical protein
MFPLPIRYLQIETISVYVPEDTEGIRQQDRDTIWTKAGERNERVKETVLGEALQIALFSKHYLH